MTTITVEVMVYAVIAGLFGAGAMWAVMRLIERAGSQTGGMVVAVGSLFTRIRSNALTAGMAVYLFSAVLFVVIYTPLMLRLELTTWPHAFFARAGFGFFTGWW